MNTWQRYLIPILGLVAILAALVAFWSVRNLTLANMAPTGGAAALELVPADEPTDFRGFVVRPAEPAAELALTDHAGEAFRLTDLRGRAVLVLFGYTYCPDVCPDTLLRLSQALELLGPDAEEVSVVFVSLDPERDTPERLAAYLSPYGERFVGLVGPLERIQEVTKGYGVRFSKEVSPGADPETGYTLAHTTTVFLIDPDGQLRTTYLGPWAPEDVAHDIGLLLSE
jgi:protein SCO1/2